MRPPVLEEGPFTLRLPRAEDVSWIYHACQDEDIQRFTFVPVPYRPADAVAWVRGADDECRAGTRLHFLVALTESGELMGAASLDLALGDGVGEIGYWVDRDARRRGVASAAVTAVERFAVSLGMREVRLRIAEENTASRALAAACGYEAAGEDPDPCKGLVTLSYRKRLPAAGDGPAGEGQASD